MMLVQNIMQRDVDDRAPRDDALAPDGPVPGAPGIRRLPVARSVEISWRSFQSRDPQGAISILRHNEW